MKQKLIGRRNKDRRCLVAGGDKSLPVPTAQPKHNPVNNRFGLKLPTQLLKVYVLSQKSLKTTACDPRIFRIKIDFFGESEILK